MEEKKKEAKPAQDDKQERREALAKKGIFQPFEKRGLADNEPTLTEEEEKRAEDHRKNRASLPSLSSEHSATSGPAA